MKKILLLFLTLNGLLFGGEGSLSESEKEDFFLGQTLYIKNEIQKWSEIEKQEDFKKLYDEKIKDLETFICSLGSESETEVFFNFIFFIEFLYKTENFFNSNLWPEVNSIINIYIRMLSITTNKKYKKNGYNFYIYIADEEGTKKLKNFIHKKIFEYIEELSSSIKELSKIDDTVDYIINISVKKKHLLEKICELPTLIDFLSQKAKKHQKETTEKLLINNAKYKLDTYIYTTKYGNGQYSLYPDKEIKYEKKRLIIEGLEEENRLRLQDEEQEAWKELRKKAAENYALIKCNEKEVEENNYTEEEKIVCSVCGKLQEDPEDFDSRHDLCVCPNPCGDCGQKSCNCLID